MGRFYSSFEMYASVLHCGPRKQGRYSLTLFVTKLWAASEAIRLAVVLTMFLSDHAFCVI